MPWYSAATPSGVRAAWAAKPSCVVTAGTGPSVSFQVTSSACRSAAVSTGSPDSRADGLATAPASRTSRWPSSRSTVTGSNSPVLYEHSNHSPSGRASASRSRSNLATLMPTTRSVSANSTPAAVTGAASRSA